MLPSIGTAVLPVVTQFPSAVVKKRLLIEFPVRLKYEMSAFVLVDVLRRVAPPFEDPVFSGVSQ